ncbi:XdhC/CoxI family protein [Pseudodesulfovibrio cashew]|uniref:XdhC/CoxI family protein n=1 Tax=Pseudodesulfovibrio cashew TaxID=2678688 RepID=A0A6I6JH39_9BACT|nr:XdhC/CoxI family protein [Pseudodesulfovibrio cashew]QGY41491.1 XdhC/CoxI family protein [Pseudodesulfovibrio cashew]
MKAFVRSVCGLLDQGEALTLASVVESSGSTPRSSGAKMAIRRDGSIIGTVGGGLAEAMAQRDGQALLAQADGTSAISFVDMTQKLTAETDMICGGGLYVLLEVVKPDGACAAAYRELDTLMRTGKRGMLETSFRKEEEWLAHDHKVLIGADAPEPGKTPIFERGEESMALHEPFIPPAPLYIFGAGHVSLFTARVGAMVGFRTVVLDDRDDFANVERFPEADQVVVLPSFTGCCADLDVGDDAFIIIVTRGHLHDKTVLAEALKTPAKYVGMIGSKSKRDKIYDTLLTEGYTQADIDRCHCPIGLTIGAQTPEEIAISIGGELIQVRSGNGK